MHQPGDGDTVGVAVSEALAVEEADVVAERDCDRVREGDGLFSVSVAVAVSDAETPVVRVAVRAALREGVVLWLGDLEPVGVPLGEPVSEALPVAVRLAVTPTDSVDEPVAVAEDDGVGVAGGGSHRHDTLKAVPTGTSPYGATSTEKVWRK